MLCSFIIFLLASLYYQLPSNNILTKKNKQKRIQGPSSSSSPSSLPPRPPAASSHLRPHPAGSRSCDSVPSPPPIRNTGRQGQNFFFQGSICPHASSCIMTNQCCGLRERYSEKERQTSSSCSVEL